MSRARKYPEELLERGTRLVFESGRPVAHVARDLGIPSESLRKYVRQVEANEGRRNDMATVEEREEIPCSLFMFPNDFERVMAGSWWTRVQSLVDGIVSDGAG